MDENIIFFDGECSFCHRWVKRIIEIDKDKHFMFAPLSGSTAAEILTGPQRKLRDAQSLVLAENYRSDDRDFAVRSRAIFRIFWIAGGKTKWIGIFSFLPCWLTDLIYRRVALHRHQFKIRLPDEPAPKDRILP